MRIAVAARSFVVRDPRARTRPRWWGLRSKKTWIVLVLLVTLAAALGGTTGTFVRLDMPTLAGLEEYEPPQMTRILAGDGSEVASYAKERRILLGHGQIPDSFRQALIASEDSRFVDHAGIDPIGALRAVWASVRRGRVVQGASTLTMQLAGNLFLDRSQRTLRRKLQEVILALEIERHYTKPEILRMYCNQVHFGHGLYGLEAAARYYFSKPARELGVGEAATLVGLLPRPASYSPLRNPDLARQRRDLVLGRMVAEGLLAPEAAERHADGPIELARRDGGRDTAPYFNEEVRQWLQGTYGSRELYRGGLVVTSTLDPRLQQAANRAVEAGLRQLDRRQGWRAGDVRRIPHGETAEGWSSPAWADGVEPDQVTDAVVVDVDAERARLRIARRTVTLTAAELAWTGVARPDRLLRVGDVVRVRTSAGGSEAVALEQTPAAEAALVALDPRTGEILALVGGFDFARSEYNRATQARRQTGSLFKPLVYATALGQRWTLADSLLDEPTVFLDPRRPVPYQPENFNHGYYETITLRTALEKSANIATVKLLERTGYEPVIDTARRLGIESRLQPYPSLALGAFELSLLEITAAYGAFANQGLLIEPHIIRHVRDRTGRTTHRTQPGVTSAVSPEVAHLMNRALSGVIRHGTGRQAGRVFSQTLAGKTGTTDEYTDAWFVGYSPGMVVGVWVGHDEPRSLGEGETGARAALPIWIDFMREALDGVADEPFPVPEDIVTIAIDPRTGRRAHGRAGCAERKLEVFIEGTEPTTYCSRALHRQLELPYPFQRYALDPSGALMIPRDELEQLLVQEPAVRLDPRTESLEYEAPTAFLRVPIVVLPAGLPDPVDDEHAVADVLETPYWTGTDGRRARVVWFRSQQAVAVMGQR